LEFVEPAYDWVTDPRTGQLPRRAFAIIAHGNEAPMTSESAMQVPDDTYIITMSGPGHSTDMIGGWQTLAGLDLAKAQAAKTPKEVLKALREAVNHAKDIPRVRLYLYGPGDMVPHIFLGFSDRGTDWTPVYNSPYAFTMEYGRPTGIFDYDNLHIDPLVQQSLVPAYVYPQGLVGPYNVMGATPVNVASRAHIGSLVRPRKNAASFTNDTIDLPTAVHHIGPGIYIVVSCRPNFDSQYILGHLAHTYGTLPQLTWRIRSQFNPNSFTTPRQADALERFIRWDTGSERNKLESYLAAHELGIIALDKSHILHVKQVLADSKSRINANRGVVHEVRDGGGRRRSRKRVSKRNVHKNKRTRR
jgi:hypothetical protein